MLFNIVIINCSCCWSTLLLQLFIRLLLVILQVHYGFLGQFQITLKLSLGSLQVHAELLLLLQRTLQLHNDELFVRHYSVK